MLINVVFSYEGYNAVKEKLLGFQVILEFPLLDIL